VTTHLLLASRVLSGGTWIEPGAVVVDGGRLAFVGAPERVGTTPARVTDLRPYALVPGFIDVHIHGWGGIRIESGAHARTVAQAMARNGTTGFLPTLSGLPEWTAYLASVEDTAASVGPTGGAEIFGLHLEGPFLNPDPAVRGVQRPETMRAPSVDDLRTIAARGRGTVRYMTLAPERPGALEVVREARRLGIATGAGHSAATYEEAAAAADAGVQTVVHTYNGMKPMHHRAPGLVGAALYHPGLTAEVIADGVHVSPVALGILIRCKGAGGVILVTDTTQFAGLPDGTYQRDGGRSVVKAGDRCYLADSGALSGSAVGMDRDVANVARLSGVTLADAVRMASTNPARLLGLTRQKGDLAAGFDADVVALDSQHGVRWTMVGGAVVWDDTGAPKGPQGEGKQR